MVACPGKQQKKQGFRHPGVLVSQALILKVVRKGREVGKKQEKQEAFSRT